MLSGLAYISYQSEVAVSLLLVLDYLHISFQSRVELCISNVIRAFPCQESPKEIPEFELRI